MGEAVKTAKAIMTHKFPSPAPCTHTSSVKPPTFKCLVDISFLCHLKLSMDRTDISFLKKNKKAPSQSPVEATTSQARGLGPLPLYLQLTKAFPGP